MDADAPADDAESPVGCGGNVRGSVDFLAGGADLLADLVDGPLGCAVDVDGLAGVVFVGSADSSAGCRALPFTANELS
jgi:hypothetical protein